MEIVLALLAVQGFVGAIDNLWHHEITQDLTSRPSARGELALHTVREFIYAVLFVAIAWWAWKGVWAAVLLALMAVEIVVTLWDFLVEDQTRKLPKFERVLHTLLAINFGAVLAFLLPVLFEWLGRPTGIGPAGYGLWSWLLTAYGVGVFIWALYDLRAVVTLGVPEWQRVLVRVGHKQRPMTVLITGATGFIGRDLTRLLVQRGDKPIVYSRDVSKARFLFGPHAEAVDDLASIPDERRIDAVVNLAGEPLLGGLWSTRRKRLLRESRIETTRRLVALVERRQQRPEVLISGSAIGYYGNHDEGDLDETCEPGTGFAAQMCRDWEAETRAAEAYGVAVCRLRIGLVLGRDGGAFPRLSLPIRIGFGAIFGDGRQWMSWIHKWDLIRIILFILDDKTVSGALNATAPMPVSNAEFSRELGRQLRRPVWLRLPAWPLRAVLGELADLFVAGQKVVPKELERLGFAFDYPVLRHAASDLLRQNAWRRDDGALDLYYNDRCPVCRTEIAHYARCGERVDARLRLHRLSAYCDDLAAYGLTGEDVQRRLYVMDDMGRLLGGADAFRALWGRLPVYRWLARAMANPVGFGLVAFVYDGIAVPLLAVLNHYLERRNAKVAAERT